MRKLVLILAVVATGLAIGGYVFFKGERKAPIRYRTAPVERGSIVSIVSATGTVNPVTMVQVGSQVSGMIESLHADFNSAVKTGDVVARIDPFPYRARRDQAAANLANAKAAVLKAKTDLAQRKRELDRVQSLLKQQFVSQNDVDVAITAHEGAVAQLAVAEAAVKQAEAALQAAELDLKYTVIQSPVNGTVISRLVEVGQRVSASFSIPTLFVVAEDLTKMQVEANVSESDIAGITEGKVATFTVDAYPGQIFRGQVRQVRNAPISVQNVVTYQVVIGVDNRDLRLKPGMTANVAIEVARRDDVLKLPNAALRFTPPRVGLADGSDGASGGHGGPPPSGSGHAAPADRSGAAKRVWRLGPMGDPEPVPIEPGISDGIVTELVQGDLKEGDQVIVGIEMPRAARGSNTLPPGFGAGQRRGSSRDRGL
ncbi:efflux RND transporter periplasmic adaptor subunit [Nitrospira sp. Kam-Ns4a]